MNRKDAAQLISRALSIFFGVFSLMETSYLPDRLCSYVFYANRAHSASPTVGDIHFYTVDRIYLGFLFFRISIYLLLAVVFWKFSPWVEHLFISENPQ
jgi:hypothetical protein